MLSFLWISYSLSSSEWLQSPLFCPFLSPFCAADFISFLTLTSYMFPHPTGQKPLFLSSLFVKPASSSSHFSGLCCFPDTLSVIQPLGVTSQKQEGVMLFRSPSDFGSASCRTTSEYPWQLWWARSHQHATTPSYEKSLYLSAHVSMTPPWPMCLLPSLASPWEPLPCALHFFRLGTTSFGLDLCLQIPMPPHDSFYQTGLTWISVVSPLSWELCNQTINTSSKAIWPFKNKIRL